jgi:hypothetical protein
MARAAYLLALSGALLITGACSGCAETQPASRDGARPPSSQAHEVLPPSAAARPRAGAVACGICYAHNWQDQGKDGYGSQASATSLAELQKLGIRRLSVTPFGWADNEKSTTVKWSSNWHAAENFGRLRTVITRAHAAGMEVILKPHIWLRGGWRATIAPATDKGGWPAWFASYRQFILAYAKLAAETKAEWFVVGVELGSSTKASPTSWRGLIAAVRRVYRGKLIYGANWDEAERIPFWDALDAIGVQMFAPLTTKKRPSLADALAGARGWLARYETLAKRFGKPLILSEAGFVNAEDGLEKPYVWPEQRDRVATAEGDRVQALGYQALLATFGRSEHVRAIYWWKWFSNPATTEEGPVGYSPRGKAALAVLRSECQKRRGAR